MLARVGPLVRGFRVKLDKGGFNRGVSAPPDSAAVAKLLRQGAQAEDCLDVGLRGHSKTAGDSGKRSVPHR